MPSTPVIINARSGTVLATGADRTVEQARALFHEGGEDADVQLVPPGEIAQRVRQHVHGGCRRVFVGGGDGTIQTVARELSGTDVAMGILPVGTINLLARDLHIPLELTRAIPLLAGGQEQAIDLAEVNGHVFTCNSVIGWMNEVHRTQERQRGMRLRAQARGVLQTIAGLLYRWPWLRVQIDLGDGPRAARTLAMVISNNLYSGSASAVPTRESIDQGVLGLYVAQPRTRLGMLALLASLPTGLWPLSSNVTQHQARELIISTRRRRIEVVNDGELLRLTPPLVYRIRPGALKVIVPKQTAERQAA